MEEWLILQSFYNGLTSSSHAHLDVVAGEAYPDSTITKAKELVEKMASN
jgi:hypothetical protein